MVYDLRRFENVWFWSNCIVAISRESQDSIKNAYQKVIQYLRGLSSVYKYLSTCNGHSEEGRQSSDSQDEAPSAGELAGPNPIQRVLMQGVMISS